MIERKTTKCLMCQSKTSLLPDFRITCLKPITSMVLQMIRLYQESAFKLCRETGDAVPGVAIMLREHIKEKRRPTDHVLFTEKAMKSRYLFCHI